MNPIALRECKLFFTEEQCHTLRAVCMMFKTLYKTTAFHNVEPKTVAIVNGSPLTIWSDFPLSKTKLLDTMALYANYDYFWNACRFGCLCTLRFYSDAYLKNFFFHFAFVSSDYAGLRLAVAYNNWHVVDFLKSRMEPPLVRLAFESLHAWNRFLFN